MNDWAEDNVPDNVWTDTGDNSTVPPNPVYGVSLFNGRQGSISPEVGDYNSFFSLLGHDHDEAYAALAHDHPASEIISGTFADARVAESNVTQHEAALTITEAQISDLGSYAVIADITYENLAANGDIGTGATQVSQGDHTHTTAGIVSGTFADARIAESNITQHEAALALTGDQIDFTGLTANSQAQAADLIIRYDTSGLENRVHQFQYLLREILERADGGVDTTINLATDYIPIYVGTLFSGAGAIIQGDDLQAAILTDPPITGTIVEDQYSLSGTTPAIDPGNGSVQYWTLTGNSTPTESIADGEFVLLMIDDGTAYTITWPTITWLTDNGSAPTLKTSGYTPIMVGQINGTLYGWRVGDGG